MEYLRASVRGTLPLYMERKDTFSVCQCTGTVLAYIGHAQGRWKEILLGSMVLVFYSAETSQRFQEIWAVSDESRVRLRYLLVKVQLFYRLRASTKGSSRFV
jgi:hypothetical protein